MIKAVRGQLSVVRCPWLRQLPVLSSAFSLCEKNNGQLTTDNGQFFMSQRRDDTTEPLPRAPAHDERAPGSYYYDDATGYELYDPVQDEDEEDDDRADDAASSV
jgi:hypothetical protein